MENLILLLILLELLLVNVGIGFVIAWGIRAVIRREQAMKEPEKTPEQLAREQEEARKQVELMEGLQNMMNFTGIPGGGGDA